MSYSLSYSSILCVHTVRLLEPIVVIFITWTFSAINLIVVILTSIGISLLFFSGSKSNATCDIRESSHQLALLLGMLTNIAMVSRNKIVKSLTTKQHSIDRGTENFYFYILNLLVCIILSLMIEVNITDLTQDIPTLINYMLMGLFAALFNHYSLEVCDRVVLLTHSILTILKRPVIILVAGLIYPYAYHKSESIFHIKTVIGIVLVTFAMLLYARGSISINGIFNTTTCFIFFYSTNQMYIVPGAPNESGFSTNIDMKNVEEQTSENENGDETIKR